MPVLLDLFLTFLKIGALSFGGGYGMISLLSEEVLSHGWLSESQLLNLIAVSESTPGPIAINMATFVGASQKGILGSMLATLGVVLPAFIIILIIASVIQRLLKYKGVQGFLGGIRPVVIGLIVATGLLLLKTVLLNVTTVKDTISFDYKALVIFCVTATVYFVYKKLKKKSISPIILIVISAILGIVLYGLV